MWVGTLDGLNLLDRKADRFINFNYSPSQTATLSSNEVNTIFEDSEHTIWVGTEKGLNRYNEADSSFTRFSSKRQAPPP